MDTPRAARDDETHAASLMTLMAQELRGPLTAVKGQTQRLLMSWESLDDRGKLAMLERINTSISRLRRLVEDIGLFSEGDESQFTLLTHPFLLEPVIRHAIDEVGARHGDRATSIVPDGANVSLYGDQYRLEQVVIILLETAVMRAPQDTSVEISYGSDGDRVRIAVADGGTPLALADWAALLDHGRPPRESVGTGWNGLALDLTVARRIAAAMDGTLSGASKAGLSTVMLDLPVTLRR
ncbi:MAG: hypothetical protein NVSMB65_10920 [Chloroflexota bacterium]